MCPTGGRMLPPSERRRWGSGSKVICPESQSLWQGQDFSCTIWLQSLCSWPLTVLTKRPQVTGAHVAACSPSYSGSLALSPSYSAVCGSHFQWHFCCSVLKCPGRTRPFRLSWSLGSSFVKHVQIVGELLSRAFLMGFIFFFFFQRKGSYCPGWLVWSATLTKGESPRGSLVHCWESAPGEWSAGTCG